MHRRTCPLLILDGKIRTAILPSRLHIHVSHPDGEAKFWLEPTIEIARNVGLSSSRINEAERLIQSHQQEITYAWNRHFCS
jgi:Domain of unknown function (DUF4160)